MTPVENGMLIGAAAAWERHCTSSSWDECSEVDLVDFAWCEDIAKPALAHYLGAASLDEDSACTVFEELPQWLQASMVRHYIVSRGMEDAYCGWKGGHSSDC